MLQSSQENQDHYDTQVDRKKSEIQSAKYGSTEEKRFEPGQHDTYFNALMPELRLLLIFNINI